MNKIIDRRTFIKRLISRLIKTAPLAAFSAIIFQYMSMPSGIRVQRRLSLGFIKDFTEEIQILRKHGIGLVKKENQVQAVSLTCTHLGCSVNRSNKGFVCPCHGSRFDSGGKVLRGPAARSLDRFSVQITADGRMVVDLGQPEVDPKA